MMSRSKKEFYLSIDPGLACTGLVLWSGGKIVKSHSILTSPRDELPKRVQVILDGVRAFVGGREIKEVAVEGFQGHRKNAMLAMMKCSCAQGALLAVAFQISEKVRLVNKGNESKEVAQKAAADLGITGPRLEHVADALRIGQLAGYGKKT